MRTFITHRSATSCSLADPADGATARRLVFGKGVRAFWFAASVVLGGCSFGPPSAPPADAREVVTLPVGVWHFSAVVQGENRYRSRTEPISEPVEGELRLLPPDHVRIDSSHGACALHVTDATTAEHRFPCGGLTLTVRPTPNGLIGSVSIGMREIREERVSCEQYQVDPQSGRETQVCLRWRYSTNHVDTRRSARTSFTEIRGETP
jgi:hypothetical protein